MKPPPKIGRLASAAERQRAQDLLDSFEINNDLDEVLLALRRFAKTGTFADTEDRRPLAARTYARWMKGRRFEDKVQTIADAMGVSESTVTRWLRTIKR